MLLTLSILFMDVALGQMKVRLGATAGFNFASITSGEEMLDLKAGIRTGAVADFGFGKMFSLSPELLFCQMGWVDNGFEGETRKATINCVQMPVNLKVKIKLVGDSRLVFIPGVYGSYALSGKAKTVFDDGDKTSNKILLGTKDGYYNPLDIGINLGMGAEIKSIMFNLQFHIGMKNISNNRSYEITNAALSLNVGYFFK